MWKESQGHQWSDSDQETRERPVHMESNHSHGSFNHISKPIKCLQGKKTRRRAIWSFWVHQQKAESNCVWSWACWGRKCNVEGIFKTIKTWEDIKSVCIEAKNLNKRQASSTNSISSKNHWAMLSFKLTKLALSSV